MVLQCESSARRFADAQSVFAVLSNLLVRARMRLSYRKRKMQPIMQRLHYSKDAIQRPHFFSLLCQVIAEPVGPKEHAQKLVTVQVTVGNPT
jgi:hypothetical protein